LLAVKIKRQNVMTGDDRSL